MLIYQHILMEIICQIIVLYCKLKLYYYIFIRWKWIKTETQHVKK